VIITANASFHGRTLATVTATGQPKYQQNFAPLVPGFHYVPYNDIAALEQAIAELNTNGQRVAAILLEPLQGEGGVRPGEQAYFRRVREVCDEQRMLLILDEVQVGIGRTGQIWGYETLGIEPDIFTSAKGLAGGIPIGAMLCKSTCDIYQPGDHARTFGLRSLPHFSARKHFRKCSAARRTTPQWSGRNCRCLSQPGRGCARLGVNQRHRVAV
jgi:acetylornithine/N-succinyldiaminopimelate aminotransferase